MASDKLAPFRAMLHQTCEEHERARLAMVIEDVMKEVAGSDESTRERLQAAIRDVVRKEFGKGTARFEAALLQVLQNLDR